MSTSDALQVVFEPDCGNAPRREITRRFAIALATGDEAELASLLAPDARCTLLGETAHSGITAIIDYSTSAPAPAELRILSVITHGRDASIDGETVSADGQLTSFCHVLRFTNTARTAPIIAVRTYRAPGAPMEGT